METYLRKCRWGLFILLRGDMISDYVKLYGEWGETEVDLFRAILPKDGVSIEVGSNIGMHAVPLSTICSEGKTYCYEPQRNLFHILCGNLALNNRLNVVARNLAVSDQRGQIQIQTSDYDQPWNYGAFSIDAGFNTEGKFGGAIRTETIEVVSLDEDPLLADIEKIDLIKADVEGAEPKVVAGAMKLIARHRPYLYLEAGSEASVAALVAVLAPMDYVGYWFLALRYRRDNYNSTPFTPEISARYDVSILFCPREKPSPDLPLVGDALKAPKGLPVLTAFPHPPGQPVEFVT
jgi:FkbM family methyltransferase